MISKETIESLGLKIIKNNIITHNDIVYKKGKAVKIDEIKIKYYLCETAAKEKIKIYYL
jgi:hypothetical protein